MVQHIFAAAEHKRRSELEKGNSGQNRNKRHFVAIKPAPRLKITTHITPQLQKKTHYNYVCALHTGASMGRSKLGARNWQTAPTTSAGIVERDGR